MKSGSSPLHGAAQKRHFDAEIGAIDDQHEAQHEGYYRLERASGAFSRSLSLPDGIDPEAVKATFEHGVQNDSRRLPSY